MLWKRCVVISPRISPNSFITLSLVVDISKVFGFFYGMNAFVFGFQHSRGYRCALCNSFEPKGQCLHEYA